MTSAVSAQVIARLRALMVMGLFLRLSPDDARIGANVALQGSHTRYLLAPKMGFLLQVLPRVILVGFVKL